AVEVQDFTDVDDGVIGLEDVEEIETPAVSDDTATLGEVEEIEEISTEEEVEGVEEAGEIEASTTPDETGDTADSVGVYERSHASLAAVAGPVTPIEVGLERVWMDSPEEHLEELEALPDIRPLPPLPYEEGLELLPAADDDESMGEYPAEGMMDRMAQVEGDSDRLDFDRLEIVSDVEELSDSVPKVGPVHGPQPQEAAEPPSAPDNGEVGELETVDELESSREPQPESPPSPDDLREELSGLLARGAIKTWTLGEMQLIVDEGKSPIVMEDGVFKINQEVYGGGAPSERDGPRLRDSSRDGGLREIAQEVVGHGPQPQPGGAEENAVGIGDLIRDETIFDFSADFAKGRGERAREEELPSDKEKACPIRLSENGLDYDGFLAFYPRSKTHGQQMKSLVEISRRVAAVSAALLVRKSDGFFPDLTVGFSEKSRRRLQFGADDPFSTLFLAERKAVGIDRNPSELRMWKEIIDQEDLRFMKRILLLPAIFASQDAYIVLAFAADQGIVLKSILSKLLVH
ncbi:MAG TPA: hypothetical protein VMU36_08715, partial [Spirochaetia bacterium]|nr:hypothetical protein [Spirochaetia bacterium]